MNCWDIRSTFTLIILVIV